MPEPVTVILTTGNMTLMATVRFFKTVDSDGNFNACISQDRLLYFQVSQYKIRFESITVQCPSAFDPAHFDGALKLSDFD